MIEIVMPSARGAYAEFLDAMFRMRYDVVVGQWGWQIPGIEPGYDKDQFDTDETVYLLCLDEHRQSVLGCCRFNPTTRPYMISSLWLDACDLQEPPQSPDAWETSRFVVSNKIGSKEEYLDVMWRLGVGLTEYCLQAGIERIVWYTEPPFYNTINSIMEVEPLGRPKQNLTDQRTYIPAIGFVTPAAVIAARANLKDPESVTTFAMAPIAEVSRPFMSLRPEAA